MSDFSIGLSALRVNQRQLDIVGQNIANANNPNYHRQVAHLAVRAVSGSQIGDGVEIVNVNRLRSGTLENAITQNTSRLTDLTSQLESMQHLEALLRPGEGSVNSLMEKLFNQLEQLSAQPSDNAQRAVVLRTANGLAASLNSLTDGMQLISRNLDTKGKLLVQEVNRLTPQIAELNQEIQKRVILGDDANDLLDRRDALIARVTEIVDVRVVETDFGQVSVLGAGQPLVIGNLSMGLSYFIDNNNQAVVSAAGSTTPANVTGGELKGVLEVRNTSLPDFRAQLDALSQELVRGLDGAHATGIGLTGPQASLVGTRPVDDINAPLASAGLGFPPQAGTLSISLTNLGTGDRTLTRLTIDPSTQSLNDLAALLQTVPNIQSAVADPVNHTLRIVANPGYGIDFAGRPPSQPTPVAVNPGSTSDLNLGGIYTGSNNDTYSLRVVNTNASPPPLQIGSTPGLRLEVRDGSNALLATLNIGQGYEPDSVLQLPNGVTLRLTAGTVSDGDTHSVPVTANADEGGLLTALGMNTLFSGDDAASLTVRPDLLADPKLLNASRTGQIGDGTNLRRLAALRDRPVLNNGTQTLREFHASLVADVGIRVQELSERQAAQQDLDQQLQAQKQGISGVDPNEELVKMLQFERAFQAASRYITVVNDSLQELFNIVR